VDTIYGVPTFYLPPQKKLSIKFIASRNVAQRKKTGGYKPPLRVIISIIKKIGKVGFCGECPVQALSMSYIPSE